MELKLWNWISEWWNSVLWNSNVEEWNSNVSQSLELKFWVSLELSSVEPECWEWNWMYGTEVLSVGTQFCETRMLKMNRSVSQSLELRIRVSVTGTGFCGTRVLRMELNVWNWSSEWWNSVLWNSNVVDGTEALVSHWNWEFVYQSLELDSVELECWEWNWMYGTEVLSDGTQFCGTRLLKMEPKR